MIIFEAYCVMAGKTDKEEVYRFFGRGKRGGVLEVKREAFYETQEKTLDLFIREEFHARIEIRKEDGDDDPVYRLKIDL